jgi:hypothetical protein
MKSRFAAVILICLLLPASAGWANSQNVMGTVYDPAAGTGRDSRFGD